MNTLNGFSIPTKGIEVFCNKNHIVKLSLFGSAARNKLTLNSDIDILVEFNKNNIPSFFDLFYMEEELSLMFNTKKIDLRTIKDLSNYIREEVLKEAKVLYES